MLQITPARLPEDWAEAKLLVEEYAHSLDFDLAFQHFDRELATLPEMYGPPGGCMLLARIEGKAVGCVALRPMDGQICEMKRLYLRPAARGSGAGRALTCEIIAQARRMGYTAIRLDTVKTMQSAVAIYHSLGFENIAPYCHNPIEGAIYMELVLSPDGAEAIHQGEAAL